MATTHIPTSIAIQVMSASTESTEMDFHFTETQDWFSHNIEHWTPLLQLVESPAPRVLEIGSWEGRSAVFLLGNLCGEDGEIVCVDHFDLLKTDAGKERFAKVEHNLSLTGKKWRVLPQFSVPALMQLLHEEMDVPEPGFDWIYLDGSHEADDTMLDSELAWRLAREGAIIIFDDYHWDKEPEESAHHPKRGIDAFLALHAGEYERFTAEEHYQVVIRKLTPMRIGFLSSTDSAGEEKFDAASFDYGVNLGLAVDSAFAIGAAVTIHSAVDHTPGRISIYIVDCGLTTDDRESLQKIVRGNDRVTMDFLSLPENGSLARQIGPVWAKLDMLGVLPVERVLYLDADTLVRRDLRPLWGTDLQGKPLGAVIDVGHPMGWDDEHHGPYFNAGVLLFDLAEVRQSLSELKELGPMYQNTKYRDQDALNAHFTSGTWVALNLKWNAQGLGTYARYPSLERDALPLVNMEDPNIVHFTGPVHPSVVEVLNPYVQPPTAKPWGYLGAPGHPYAAEWKAAFEKTPWTSKKEALVRSQKQARLKAIESMNSVFDEAVQRLGISLL